MWRADMSKQLPTVSPAYIVTAAEQAKGRIHTQMKKTKSSKLKKSKYLQGSIAD